MKKVKISEDPKEGAKEKKNGKNKNSACVNQKSEKYLVVISNVENDLSKIHQTYLPSFFGLKPANTRFSEDECSYDIKCRNETRSAEIVFTGPPSADISSVFLKSSPARSTGDGDAAEQDVTEAVDTARPVASIEGRVATLLRRPYFSQYVGYHVNLPDQPDGAVLHPGPRKRGRTEEGENEPDQSVRQSPRSQKDLVSAVAIPTTTWTTRQLKKHLTDLPGFISCWYLSPHHFRVVFCNTETLFRAKKLLDEFEIEGKVRVNLQLSDFFQRQYEASLALENQEAAL